MSQPVGGIHGFTALRNTMDDRPRRYHLFRLLSSLNSSTEVIHEVEEDDTLYVRSRKPADKFPVLPGRAFPLLDCVDQTRWSVAKWQGINSYAFSYFFSHDAL